MKITLVQCILAKPPSDIWAWVRLRTDRGLEGWGEYTGNPLTDASVSAVIGALAPGLVGKDLSGAGEALEAVRRWRYPSHMDNRSIVMAVSALDMALWDLRAREQGVSLARLLGGREEREIPLYANLNRLLRKDRSLSKLIVSARTAVEDGMPMVKIAPFDEVTPLEERPDVEPGLERWRETGREIGQNRLSVDCHCRFQNAAFRKMILDLGAEAQSPLFWEDPVRIHRACDLSYLSRELPGLRLASGEDCFAAQELRELSQSGQLAILNPDLKYIGGVTAAFSLLPELMERVNVCLHNPSGPIATAHSAHVSSLLGKDTLLEFAYGDQNARNQALAGGEPVERGRYVLSSKPGVGVEPSLSFLERYGSIVKEVG